MSFFCKLWFNQIRTNIEKKKTHSTNIETKRKYRIILRSSFDSFRSQKYWLFNNHDISVFNLNSLENSNDLQIKRTNEWTIQTKCPWFSNEPNAFLFRLKKKMKRNKFASIFTRRNMNSAHRPAILSRKLNAKRWKVLRKNRSTWATTTTTTIK